MDVPVAPADLAPLAWDFAALCLGALCGLCAGLVLNGLWLASAQVLRPASRVERYAAARRADRTRRLGERIAASPLLGPGPRRTLDHWCRWRNLGTAEDERIDPAHILGQAVLYGAPVAALALPLQSWVMLLMALVAALVPAMRVRDTGLRNRKDLRRSLPELLALVAGELEVNTPLEQALRSAVGWGSPAGPLIAAAVTTASAGETPLFTRFATDAAAAPAQPGTLLAGADEFGDSDWRSVVLAFDSVAAQGVNGPESLQQLADHLVTATKQELEETSEKLEDRLLLPLVICFFPVMLSLTVLPMALPLTRLF